MCVYSRSVMSDTLRPYGLSPTSVDRFLRPWNFPDKNTGMGCHILLQGIFPIKGSNPLNEGSAQFSSVHFSHSVVSNFLWPHELQHARPPCPSPTPRVHSDSCPLSQWCHPAISSSVLPFSSCLQYLPASKSFPMSQLFTWGGQSTGVSALASFLQRTPRTDLLQNGLVGSPCSPRDSQESSPTP